MSAGSGNNAWAVKAADPAKAQANYQRNLMDLEARTRGAAAKMNAVPGAEHVQQFYSPTGGAGTITMDAQRMSAFADIQEQREGQREASKYRSKFKLNPDGTRVRNEGTVINLDALPSMGQRGNAERQKTIAGQKPGQTELQKLVQKESEARAKLERNFATSADKNRAKRVYDKALKKREDYEASLGRNRRGRGRTRAGDEKAGVLKRFYKHYVERRTSVIAIGEPDAADDPKGAKRVPGGASKPGGPSATRAEREAAAAEKAEADASKRKEARKVIKTLGLGQRELRYLKTQFELIDTDSSGDIDYGEFFEFIDEVPSPYTDAFFDLIDYDNNGGLPPPAARCGCACLLPRSPPLPFFRWQAASTSRSSSSRCPHSPCTARTTSSGSASAPSTRTAAATSTSTSTPA